MRRLLLVTLLAGCQDALPNTPIDAGEPDTPAGDAAEGEGERSALPRARLLFRGQLGADGRAAIEVTGVAPARLPLVQAWQEAGGTWSTDVVARIAGPDLIELAGAAGARYQLIVLP